MEKQIIRRLNLYYYTMMALAVVSATLSYYFVVKQHLIGFIDPLSTAGQILQYFVIFDVLLTIPGGLWLHKRKCKALAALEAKNKPEGGEPDDSVGDATLIAYRRSAAWRIVLVSNSMIFAIAAFYLMGAYKSMIWCAAIAAIGWYFTKPTEKKMYFELHPQEETY